MGGWADCVAIKLGNKLKTAAGLFNPLILKTRKTTICFYPPAMPAVLSPLFFWLDYLYLFSYFSCSIRLYHSILLFFHVSPLFPPFHNLFFLSRSGPLGNQRTWITFVSPREQKLIWSSWEHTHPDTTGTVSLSNQGKRDDFMFPGPLWLACREEMPIKYRCERSKLVEVEQLLRKRIKDAEREGGYSL